MAGDRTIRSHPVRLALSALPARGVRRYWIRQRGAQLLKLRCVESLATTLRERERRALEAPDSDGRAEAAVRILETCVERLDDVTYRRLLTIVLDFSGEHRDRSANFRRDLAGQQFRGTDARPLRATTVRQIHEPLALDALATELLAYDARHDSAQ